MQQASCGTQRAGAVQVRPATASDRTQSKLHASHAASSPADEPQVLVPQHGEQTAAADVGGAVGADVGGDEAVGDGDGDIDGDGVGSEGVWDSAGAEVDGAGVAVDGGGLPSRSRWGCRSPADVSYCDQCR